MKTILFPTDFSENSMHAAQYAAMLAQRYDAKLILLHVYNIPINIGPEYSTLDNNLIMDEELQKIEKVNLDVFFKKLIHLFHLPEVQVDQILEFGFVSEAINHTAEKFHADMIVVGTKGVSNQLDKIIGSNAESVIKTAPCPVWVVPVNASIHAPNLFLYAADLEENESKATQLLMDFASPFAAECKVVHIKEYFDKELELKNNESIESLKKEFAGKKITFKELTRKEIVEGIETYAGNINPDVLALGVYDKTFFSNMFNSSIVKHFVEESKIPMLIFKKEKS